MKIVRKILLAVLIVSTGALSTGCFGSFSLTQKFYKWHDATIENKFLKSLLFYIPFGFVYAATVTIDVVILNLIEFWGGSNPVTMNEGDYEVEYKTYAEVDYKIEATKNQFKMTALSGDNAGAITYVRFDAETKTWLYETENSSVALMSFEMDDNKQLVHVYQNNGQKVTLNMNTEYTEAALVAKFSEANSSELTASK